MCSSKYTITWSSRICRFFKSRKFPRNYFAVGKYNNTIGDKLKYSPKNAIYTSPDIQNELLSIMVTKIQQEIVLDVLSARFFCVMSDESKDCAKIEQLVISLRHVDQSSSQIRERTI